MYFGVFDPPDRETLIGFDFVTSRFSSISTLFKTFFTDYEKMPPEHALRAKLATEEAGVAGAARVVSDYVAGMTDSFAMQAHAALPRQPATNS